MGLVDCIVKVVKSDHVDFGEKYYVETNVSIYTPEVIHLSSAVANICTHLLSVGT